MEESSANVSAPASFVAPSSQPSKQWARIGVIAVGIILLLSLISGAYWLGTKQSQFVSQTQKTQTSAEKTQTATQQPVLNPIGQTVQVDKLLLTVNKVQDQNQLFSFIDPDKKAIFLEVTFENKNAVEGKDATDAQLRFDARGFRLTDEEGFVQNLVVPNETVRQEVKDLGVINFIEMLAVEKLAVGEKSKGYLIFAVDKNKSKFILTYGGVKFSIIPETTPTTIPGSKTMPTTFSGNDSIPVDALQIIEKVKDDLVKRKGVKRETIKFSYGASLKEADAWLNMSSWCMPGKTSLMTDEQKGYFLIFEITGTNRSYNYETSNDPKNPILIFCQEPSPMPFNF